MSPEGVSGRSITSAIGLVANRILPLRETVEPPVHPFVPLAWDEVPEAALRDLRPVCPNVGLERLFVIPTVLMTRGRRLRPMSPSHVVVFGDDVVAIWTDDGGRRRVAAMPTADLLALDDRTILLDGRLSFLGAGSRFGVAYNTVSRADVRLNVRRLRLQIAGPPVPTLSAFLWIGKRGASSDAADLPYKWSYLLRCDPNLRLDPGEPAMIAVGNVVELHHALALPHARRPASGLAILGPRELAIATEPVESLEHGRYGVDLTTVPRRFVRELGWDGKALRIVIQTADGKPAEPIARPLDLLLVEAMRECFGDALPWK